MINTIYLMLMHCLCVGFFSDDAQDTNGDMSHFKLDLIGIILTFDFICKPFNMIVGL